MEAKKIAPPTKSTWSKTNTSEAGRNRVNPPSWATVLETLGSIFCLAPFGVIDPLNSTKGIAVPASAACRRLPPRSDVHQQSHVLGGARHFERRQAILGADHEIERGAAERQIADGDATSQGGHDGFDQPHGALNGVEAQSEHRGQQRQWRARRPGLRRTGGRIQRRSAAGTAPEAAVELGDAPVV